MKKETVEEVTKKFKLGAFVLLLFLAIELPVVLVLKLINQSIEIPDVIYMYNCVLCVISLVNICIFAIYRFSKIIKDKQFSLKKSITKNWPCILLAIFMIWTSVGCIQAGMEAGAEAYIKEHSSKDANYEYYKEIADWSETDRMTNAADRSWNGCVNLKDGYFSFLFYAAIMINVLMLGVDRENFKRYVMRSLAISSFIIGLLTLLSFFRYSTFVGTIYFDRSLFNNRNHFGYYIAVILPLSLTLFLKEENLYFKVVAFLNTFLYMFLLFMCNTFGTFLGALAGMIYIFIVTLIGAIANGRIREFAKYVFFLAVFLFWTLTYVETTSTAYRISNELDFDYATYRYTIGDSTYQLSINTISEADAETLKLGDQSSQNIYWGTQINKLDDKIDTFVARNFKTSSADYLKMIDKFKASNKGTEDNTQIEDPREVREQVTQEQLQEKLNEIGAKYPKISGESLEEWQARQALIQEEFQAYRETVDLIDDSSVTTEDFSNVGSGRGPTWIKSLDLMNQRPWFGWGLENLLNEFYEQYNISEGRTHNLILQLGGTTGIPGVLMYLVATISIWIKVLFDAKFRKYSKKTLGIIAGIYVITIVALNVLISHYTDKLFFNGIITVMVLALMTICIFTKKVHLRIKDFNKFEFISSVVFVVYMINALFGNSAFYTSPYFTLFLGMLACEAINKKNFFDESNEALEKKQDEKPIKTKAK